MVCVLLLGLVSLAGVESAVPANTGRWLIFGGFTADQPLSQVEVLTLGSQSSYGQVTQWCSRNLSNMNLPLDGATVNYISVFDFLDANVATANFGTPYDGIIWDRALICGGADSNYNIQSKCRWWLPETDSYLEQGPTMMVPRFQAATFYKADQGFLWMLGGRTGSNILIDNELMWLPQKIKTVRTINKWSWLNKLALDSAGWSAVPAAMTTLPIPLAGHCVVSVQYNGKEVALVLGGGTTDIMTFPNGTIGPKAFTGPIPTNHVHLYDFQLNKWFSTFSTTPALSKMNVARMNHGCVAFTEGGQQKVMVAGGIGLDYSGQTVPLNSVETITLTGTGSPPGASWFQEAVLPDKLTGTKMILVNSRPAIVGRFGEEKINSLFLYTPLQAWEPLAATIAVGRGDFQIVPDFTNSVPILPILSGNTMATQGAGYSFISENLRTGTPVTTGAAVNPWIQLDLGVNVTVTQVNFVSPGAATCATGCVAAFPKQLAEVRVGYAPVQFDQSGPITLNTVCGTPIDGVTSQTATCSLVGQYLTIQLKDPANTAAVSLAVNQLRVYAATPTCTAAQTG